MTNKQQKEKLEADLKARKLRLKLVADEFNKLQILAEELAVQNFKDEARIKELNELIMLEAYQKKILRAIGLAMIVLMPLLSHAQAHLDFGGGIVKSQDVFPVMKISVGYQINNVVTEALMQPAVTRKVNAPRYFGLKAGYNFHNIIPSIGYLYNYKSADDKRMNGWDIGYALKYQIQENDNGGVYIEGMYVNCNYELTAGFHVIF